MRACSGSIASSRVKRLVQRRKHGVLAAGANQRVDQRHPVEAAPPLLRAARARPLDQDLPHRPRGDPDEVAFVVPRRARTRQPEVGLVHERRGLKGLARPLAAHEGPRQAPQLVVHLRRQLVCVGRGHRCRSSAMCVGPNCRARERTDTNSLFQASHSRGRSERTR